MDYKKIEKLIDKISNSDLTEVDLELEGFKLKLKKEKEVVHVQQPVVAPTVVQQVQQETVQTEQPVGQTPVKETRADNIKIIKSPMVGTFYSASSPDTPPFASVGDKIKKGDTVCIVEAMKLMNEIESEFDGIIKKVLVENEDTIEFGQELFEIEVG